jgi:hypothetical protein
MVASDFDLFDRNHAAFDNARLESKLRIVLGILRQHFGQRDRIALGIGNRSDALQVFSAPFDFGALRRPFSQRVFHYGILRAGAAQRLAKLKSCATVILV